MGYSSTTEQFPPPVSTVQKCSANQTVTGGSNTTTSMEDLDSEAAEPANQYQNEREDSNSSTDSSSDDEVEVKTILEDEIHPDDSRYLIKCSLPRFNKPPSFSWVSPKLICKKSPTGFGLFASVPLKKDSVLVSWSGKLVHVDDIRRMSPEERTYILQVDDELFQIPPWNGYNEPADFTNHSCNPNAGFRHSPSTLVAMRDIQVGEEITFDYAMAESIDALEGNEFECCCGADICRRQFTGHDWMNPQLWERYGDYFSPYLRDKIRALKAQTQKQ